MSDEQVEAVVSSDSFGPLTAELRRADANGHDADRLLPAVAARRSLDDAHDVGAVLIRRLQKAAQSKRGKHRGQPNLVAGLVPVAQGPMSAEMAMALAERQSLMQTRAEALAERAIGADEPWLRSLGAAPDEDLALRAWTREVRTVAAYRDRYQVGGRRALGEPRTEAQRQDAARAADAISRARAIAVRDAESEGERRRSGPRRAPVIG